MVDPKLQAIAPEGWTYVGEDAGDYLYQAGSYESGFKLMVCRQEDLTKENLALMARLNVSR